MSSVISEAGTATADGRVRDDPVRGSGIRAAQGAVGATWSRAARTVVGATGFGQPLGGEGLVKGAMGWYLGGYLCGERVWRGTPAHNRYVTTVDTVETPFSRNLSHGLDGCVRREGVT
jgi:hypothetical protein